MEPIPLYSLEVEGHGRQGLVVLGQEQVRCDGRDPARKRLKAYHGTPRYSPSVPTRHNEQRPLKPCDEVSSPVNAVRCYSTPGRLQVGWAISPRQAWPGYRR